jgi:hypothetical protein
MKLKKPKVELPPEDVPFDDVVRRLLAAAPKHKDADPKPKQTKRPRPQPKT